MSAPVPSTLHEPHSERRSTLATLLSPKVGIPLVFLLVLSCGPFVFRASRVAGIPDLGDPFDRAAFGTVVIPPGENAYEEYLPALKMLTPPPSSSGPVDPLAVAVDHGWEHASDAIRGWVESNRPALARWKQGTAKPAAVYIQPKDLRLDTLLPAIQEMRNMARLARIEASRLELEGKLDEAWEIHHALFRCSRHLGQHGCFIECLVGIALHGLSTIGLERWAAHPDITAPQLEHAIASLRDDYAKTAPLSNAVKTEYLFVMQTIEGGNLAESLAASGETIGRMGKVGLFLINEPLVSQLVLKQYFANFLAHCDKPRPDRPPLATPTTWGLFEPDPKTPLPPNRMTPAQIEQAFRKAPIAAQFVPALTSVDRAFAKEQARQAAFLTVLAVRLYQKKNGGLPADLQALVDASILSEMPADPFSGTGEPLLYKREGDKVVVWSLGENGVDDGGMVDNLLFKGPLTDIGFRIPPYRDPLPETSAAENPEATAP